MASFLQQPSVTLILAIAGIYLFVSIIQTAYTSYRRQLFKQDKGCKPEPRFPQRDTFLGTDLFLQNVKYARDGGFLEMVKGRYEKVGASTWSSVLPPGERFLQTVDPENIKAMLATQFKDFELPALRKSAFAPIFGHGIFTTDGTEWETSRSLLRPNFNRAQVADLDMLEQHVSKVIARIPHDGSTVDLQTLFFMLTLDSATEFLFGQSAGSLDLGQSYERGMKFAQAFTDSTIQTGNIIRVPASLAFLLRTKKYKADVKYVHEYVSSYVQRAVDLHKSTAEKSEKYVFLEELAKTGFGAKKIQDELLNILLAGRDTTAGLLSYLFYTLAREPQVWMKLQAEIAQFEGKSPTYEQVKGLKYMQWVMNEALRLFPIVAINARAAARDTTLPVGGGPDRKSPIFVKKGQNINYSVYVMHRRKDIYGEDAEEFKPERWETLRPGWGYLPFNGGPRICIGQQFALMEASYTTIRILQKFKSIEKRDDTPFLEQLTITAAVRGGVQVGLTPY